MTIPAPQFGSSFDNVRTTVLQPSTGSAFFPGMTSRTRPPHQTPALLPVTAVRVTIEHEAFQEDEQALRCLGLLVQSKTKRWHGGTGEVFVWVDHAGLEVVEALSANHLQVRTEIQPPTTPIRQGVTEQTSQAEVEPSPLLETLLSFPSTRHMASSAACLDVRLVHQGILCPSVCQSMRSDRIESTATASVTRGAADSIRKMAPQTRSMGSERKGDVVFTQITSFDTQVARRTSIHLGRTRVVLPDTQFHFLIRTGESRAQEFLLQDSPRRLLGADHDKDQHTQQCTGRYQKADPQATMLSFSCVIGQEPIPPKARRRPTSVRGTRQRR